MKGYKKFRAIHRIAYITLFIYLLVLSLGNIDFGGYADYVPFFIIVPFLGYCILAIIVEVMIQRYWKKRNSVRDEIKEKTIEYKGVEKPGLSNI